MSNIPADILVVDDNPATRYSTSRVLKSAGWTVVEAETGAEAIAIAQKGVDLVVLDVNLPDIDGFAVCRKLREAEATARLPILHLSATFVTTDAKVTGLESGADGYLTHPIEPPVLIATVNAFLRARSAETELRRSNARFKAIFDNALNGVSVLDDNLVYVDANPSMCELLGMRSDEVIGRRLADLVPADRRGEISTIAGDLEQQRAWRGPLPLTRGDGTPVYLEWNISVHRVPGLRLAIVSDITERLRYEQERELLLLGEQAARAEAERANGLKDDFLATLSHELRTPLNSIVGWAQLLRLGTLSGQEVAEGMEAIERNALAQSQMIADLLDVSRITTGKIRLDLHPLDVGSAVETAVTAILPTAAAKGVAVAKRLNAEASQILADASRLQQILSNLINNAVKFTPAGGTVRIDLERSGAEVEIRVADNGQGISRELLPQVFDRFRQGDSSSTREHGGLGLGLAIAKQLVEMHGGTITAESAGEGRGALFTVRIPTADRASQPAPSTAPTAQSSEPSAPRHPADLNGLRVLVVEDDKDSRAILKMIVTGAGAQVGEAASANEALGLLTTFRPNVLISDVGMPGRDGLELIREVRARGYTEEALPAVALTAFARAEDRHRALLAGFQVYLTKPVDGRELNASIASLTRRTDNGSPEPGPGR